MEECFEKAGVYLYSSFDFDHCVYGYDRYSKAFFVHIQVADIEPVYFTLMVNFFVHRSGSLFVLRTLMSCMGFGI